MKQKNCDFYQVLTGKVIESAKKVAAYIAQESLSFNLAKVETKNRNDFVSYVDKEAERVLVNQLSVLLPEAGFITEEGIGEYHGENYCWVIDPLDGTTNFIHNSTPYAVSVSLLHRGEPVVGVIHEITRDETFYAWNGSKAFLNGKEIRVSVVKHVKDALIATGQPHNYIDQYDKLLNSIGYFLLNSQGIRQSGSAATDLAYVACGRYDGRFEFGLKAWDIAAGVLIIKQAGGNVSDFEGGDNYFSSGDVLVSNPYISEELKEIIFSIFKDNKSISK